MLPPSSGCNASGFGGIRGTGTACVKLLCSLMTVSSRDVRAVGFLRLEAVARPSRPTLTQFRPPRAVQVNTVYATLMPLVDIIRAINLLRTTCHFLFCSLFDTAVSDSGFIALIVGRPAKYEMHFGSSGDPSRYYPDIYLEALRNTTINMLE